MKIRVGLIGLGDQWNARHRPALVALSDRFEVTAICCEVAELSKSVADEFGAVPVDGFRAMIERNDIDAVLALSPDWVGPLPLIAASEAGKAVYSSTALDIVPGQALEIRKRIDASGVAFMAEFPRRYSPATIRLKELIATRIGQPHLLFCHDRMPVERQSDRLRRGDYCPLVWKHMMEQVDWCRYIVGADPVSVVSSVYDSPGDQQTFYQSVSLEFPTSKSGIKPLAQLSLDTISRNDGRTHSPIDVRPRFRFGAMTGWHFWISPTICPGLTMLANTMSLWKQNDRLANRCWASSIVPLPAWFEINRG